MSSCGGSCNCGSGCSCGDSCNCRSCGVEKVATNTTFIAGFAPVKAVFVGASVEGDGCNCGDDCSCDPCTC